MAESDRENEHRQRLEREGVQRSDVRETIIDTYDPPPSYYSLQLEHEANSDIIHHPLVRRSHATTALEDIHAFHKMFSGVSGFPYSKYMSRLRMCMY